MEDEHSAAMVVNLASRSLLAVLAVRSRQSAREPTRPHRQSLVGANPQIVAVPGECTARRRDDPKLPAVVPRRARCRASVSLKRSESTMCEQQVLRRRKLRNCPIASVWMACLYLNMAELIPFPPKSIAPSKCSTFSRCSDKLICPSCQYVACSSGDLHAHVERMHPLTPERSMPLQFGRRPSVEEDLK